MTTVVSALATRSQLTTPLRLGVRFVRRGRQYCTVVTVGAVGTCRTWRPLASFHWTLHCNKRELIDAAQTSPTRNIQAVFPATVTTRKFIPEGFLICGNPGHPGNGSPAINALITSYHSQYVVWVFRNLLQNFPQFFATTVHTNRRKWTKFC